MPKTATRKTSSKLILVVVILLAIVIGLMGFMAYYGDKHPCSNAGRLMGNCSDN